MFPNPKYAKLSESQEKSLLASLEERSHTLRMQTVYKLSVLAVAAFTTAAAELARRWMADGTKKEDDPLDKNDPAGFHPRNEIIWKLARAVILPIGHLNWVLGNLKLVGIEYVREALQQGKGNQVVGNHTSILDTFFPQLILWFYGFKELAEDIFRYLIGIKFVNRRPLISMIIKGGHYWTLAPPTVLKKGYLRTLSKEERRQHLRNAQRINTAAFSGLGESLDQGVWTLLFPEGERVLEGSMRKVHVGVAAALRHPGTNIQPMAIVGPNRMWPPGSWVPKIVGKVKVIFGKPIPYEEVAANAKAISKRHEVSEDRALCDFVMRKIAVLMIENGHPEYAGYYSRSLEQIYSKGGENASEADVI